LVETPSRSPTSYERRAPLRHSFLHRLLLQNFDAQGRNFGSAEGNMSQVKGRGERVCIIKVGRLSCVRVPHYMGVLRVRIIAR